LIAGRAASDRSAFHFERAGMNESLDAFQPSGRRIDDARLNDWMNLLATAYVVGTPAEDAGSDPFDYVPERLDESGPPPLHHSTSAMVLAVAK
jgi:hypothetical protein